VTGKIDILVIDDDDVIRDSCRQVLSASGYEVTTALDGIAGLELLTEKPFDIILLDLRMPDMDGMEVLRKIREKRPGTCVIVITGHATIESAVEAMQLGADDYLSKPFIPDVLRMTVRKAVEKKSLVDENLFLKEQLMVRSEGELIIGTNRAMREIYQLVKKVAPTDSTVLICGESGTGKEILARAIHYYSLRRERPFVAVDCGSLAETLIESELFGHVKGSFTGAISTKYGRFELANGGTIFLDDIGNIGPGIQAKLLRVIQEREIVKVGGSHPSKIDVRIITATNKDLEKEIREGRFREDLFYRLNVLPIVLPPLRERKDDIPALVSHFIRKYAQRRKKEITSITEEAMKILLEHDWPGNIRELENVIERLVVLAEKDPIRGADLSSWKLGLDGNSGTEMNGMKRLADMERAHIQKVLALTGWQKSKAALILGIDRKTLYRKIKEFDLSE
jgi:DNA-binding NtrC family response regulator